MTLGNKIYNERKRKGFSQEELAQQIGVSRQTVYKWENDQAMPDLVNLRKLASVFEVRLEDLFEEKETDFENSTARRPMRERDPMETLDRAAKTGSRMIKKHWRKGGYVLIYWGIGMLVFGLIARLMFSPAYSSEWGMFGFEMHHGDVFSSTLMVFKIFPYIFIIGGMALIVVGFYLVKKDQKLNRQAQEEEGRL